MNDKGKNTTGITSKTGPIPDDHFENESRPSENPQLPYSEDTLKAIREAAQKASEQAKIK